MQLPQDLRGISNLMLIILLLLAFVVGATISYVWTMGYYASPEFQLPKEVDLTIEDVAFSVQDTTFFNVTILNPSFSPSSAEINQIVALADGHIYTVVVSPSLPFTLKTGSFQTFRGTWNWANYTGQNVTLVASVSEGSGPNREVKTPFVGLEVKAHFNSSVSIQHFNITVESAATSATHVNIAELAINGKVISPESIRLNGESVAFPYFLNLSESALFTCLFNWTKYQGQGVTVTAETLQGYRAEHVVATPQTVELAITAITFNSIIGTDHFNMTFTNFPTSGAYVDINEILMHVNNETISIADWRAFPEHRVKPSSTVLLVCTQDWQDYRNTTATVTIRTLQGFQVSGQKEIP